MRLAVPDMVSNSYFPAEAAVELGYFSKHGLDVSLELIFPVDKCYEALREGKIDIVAGSAHSALAAFPNFDGVQLLCAQSQGMYWFLVMHSELKAKAGDIESVKGRTIGAAPWVDLGLKQVLRASGYDLERDRINIVPVPIQAGAGPNFGLNAARALEARQIDGFWANGMAAEIALNSGVGTLVFDARRSRQPAGAFHYTMASVAMRTKFIEAHPGIAISVTKAIVDTQRALKADVEQAAAVGRALFPPNESNLIVELVRRDIPYYQSAVVPESVAGMSRFCRNCGILSSDLEYNRVVAGVTRDCWES
jgi:NitT/TauT family transport system substrate-binding protein